MSGSRSSTLVRYGYGVAAGLWLAALLLPAAVVNDSMHLDGFRVFMIGIDALSAGMPGWLANPCMAAAVVAGLRRHLSAAVVLSGLAAALSLSSFFAPALARSRGMPIDEVAFKSGFFLWLAACSLILATSFYALVALRRASSEPA